MSILCKTSLPLTESSSPIDLSAELDKECVTRAIQLGLSSNSFQSAGTPLQGRIAINGENLSDSGSIKIDFLPQRLPMEYPEEKLRQFAAMNPHISSQVISEQLGDKRFARAPFLNPKEEQIYQAWICALMMEGKCSYDVSSELLELVPQNSPLCEKLYFSLLTLGNKREHNKEKIEKLAIRLITRGLNLSASYENLGSPLHAACIYGYLGVAQKILSMPKVNPSIEDSEGFTAVSRTAEYLEKHGDSSDMQALIKAFFQHFNNRTIAHLKPTERFKALARLQGYIDNPYPPSVPQAYKQHHAKLLGTYYEKKQRPTHRKKKSSGSFGFKKAFSSRKLSKLPEEPASKETEISELKTRFESGLYPSSKKIHGVFEKLLDNKEWGLVDELLALLMEYGKNRYTKLLIVMRQDIEKCPNCHRQKKRRLQSINSLFGTRHQSFSHPLVL